jgi:hypothetical protein
MKRIPLAVAAALLVVLAACGPDCDRFCKHWAGDCAAALSIANPDVPRCISACNEVGGDYTAFISCVIDKTCPELAQGHCQIPSVPPGFAQ